MIPPRQPAVISKFLREIFHWVLRPACVPMPENVLWSVIHLRPSSAKPLAVAERSLNCSWCTDVRRSVVSICRWL